MVARATILDFPMGTILITFDLQVTLMCPIKFQVNWPFHSGQIQKLIFKMATVAAILDFQSEQQIRTILVNFWSISHLDTSYQVSSQLAFLLWI